MLIDTHCHLHDPEFFSKPQQLEFLENAHKQDVQKIIVIGTDPEDSKTAQQFALAHDNVFWTYGIHPEHAHHDVAEVASDIFERLKRAKAERAEGDTRKDGLSTGSRENNASHFGKLVAIGEIGLDYHYDGYNRTAQIRLFEQMLQLAQDLALPVSLHLREAFADSWAVLDNFPHLCGVVHSFTGSKQELKHALSRNFYIGVNGLATYTTPALPPLEKMLLETDAPFLTPVPFRGTINQPAYVHNIATYLAGKMGVAEVNIAEQTTTNAKQLFQI